MKVLSSSNLYANTHSLKVICNHGKCPSPKAKSFPRIKSASYIVRTKSQFLLRKSSGMAKGIGSGKMGELQLRHVALALIQRGLLLYSLRETLGLWKSSIGACKGLRPVRSCPQDRGKPVHLSVICGELVGFQFPIFR